MIGSTCSTVAALAALATPSFQAACAACKCTPLDHCWPSEETFARLNQSVSGRLIRTVPPASVCYTEQPNYDPKACETILTSWFDSAFHYHDPTSVDSPIWAGNPCPPIFPNGTSVTGNPDAGAKGCDIGGYPVYAVNATEASHVQEAVNFARENNIRLNVKSTGHSFQGRSTAYGSLSVYTGHYRRIEYHDDFQPRNCPLTGPQMAATLGAGETMRPVYKELAKHNVFVVGGSAQTVGVIGWATGGGHGPASSDYGMGVDNLLQVTMVTPDGELVTANACQNSDLFWAVRGGGGGTFGVVLEVVMKAYPSPKATLYSMDVQFVSPNETDNWRMVAYMHSQLPRLKQGGLQGFYGIIPASVAGALTFQLGFFAYDKPNGTAEALFEPIRRKLDGSTGTARYTSSVYHFSSFYELWDAYVGFEAVAQSGVGFGSWLLPADSLTEDIDQLAQAFSSVAAQRNDETPVFLLGHMVANAENRSLDVSMNSAWRDAVTHLIVVDPFPDFADKATREEVYNHMTYTRIPILKNLAPRSGAYFNEADPFDPDFQHTFWGENYARLRELKARYDPKSVLWCLGCVGSETWATRDDGRLCRA
jgi:FAD/FMN-containing dehydrogenase